MFDGDRFVVRKMYDLDDLDSIIKDTEFSLDIMEAIAKKNNATLQEIFAQKIFPSGITFLDMYTNETDKKLTIIEHVYKKSNSSLSYKDPKNKISVIGKLKKVMWQDKLQKKLIVDYDARIQDADYFI